MREQKVDSQVKLTEMMDQRMMREMKNLVIFFYVALRNARIHGFVNEAFQQPLRRFAETLNSILALEGALSLRVAESYIFVNEQRLRFDIEGFLSYTRLVEELKGCRIGSVIFREAIETEELRDFISLFLALDANAENPSQILQERLIQRGISHVTVEGPVTPRFSAGRINSKGRELAKATFLKAITKIGGVLNQAAASERIDMKGSKRVVQSLVDLILGEDLFILV